MRKRAVLTTAGCAGRTIDRWPDEPARLLLRARQTAATSPTRALRLSGSARPGPCHETKSQMAGVAPDHIRPALLTTMWPRPDASTTVCGRSVCRLTCPDGRV